MTKSSKAGNDLVFDSQDILSVEFILIKLMRQIFYTNKITVNQLHEKITLYYQARNVSNYSISMAKYNLLDAINNDKVLTWKKFENILKIVFDSIITKFDIELLDISSETEYKNKFHVKR